VDPHGVATKFRCPVCQATAIKALKSGEFRYRCDKGHRFNEPIADVVSVTTYRAWYGGTYLTPTRKLSHDAALDFLAGSRLEPASIRRLNIDRLDELVDRLQPRFAALGGEHSGDRLIANDRPEYRTDSDAVRAANFGDISRRRGKTAFRAALRERYCDRCVISGCTIIDLLEAAHIDPMRSPGLDEPANGLLLRADLHTLFDLDLIGINPADHTVVVKDALSDPDYRRFHNRSLNDAVIRVLNKEALQHRWERFLVRPYPASISQPKLI
jgi:putative restriction endonuclease